MSRLAALHAGTARKEATAEETTLIALASDRSALAATLAQLKQGRVVFRPDLYDSLIKAARLATLTEGAKAVHAQRAREGRRVEQRSIGSTLLLKGLEADHAVVFDADHMGPKDLYVAISRARRRLTVVSRSPVLPLL